MTLSMEHRLTNTNFITEESEGLPRMSEFDPRDIGKLVARLKPIRSELQLGVTIGKNNEIHDGNPQVRVGND